MKSNLRVLYKNIIRGYVSSLLKILFVAFTFFLNSSNVLSQSIIFGLQAGLGNYSMEDLRIINNNTIKSLPFDAKIIANYPQYYYYQPELMLSLKQINVGFTNSFQSTGSRISAKDYSGEYRFDSKIKSSCYGVVSDLKPFPSRLTFIGLALYAKTGYIKSILEFSEALSLDNLNIAKNVLVFESTNYYSEPGFKASLQIYNLIFQLNFGYFLQFGDNSFVDKNSYELRVFGRKVKPEWNGLRIGGSLLLSLPLSSKV